MSEETLREVQLPSGATLKLNAAPFRDAHALFQAFLAFQSIINQFYPAELLKKEDQKEALRSLIPWALSSQQFHQALTVCFKRCLYKTNIPGPTDADLPVNDKTFETPEARGDFAKVCVEVAVENLDPFMSGLWRELSGKPKAPESSSQR